MKILYLIPDQEISPITTRFVAKVATRMGVGVHVLVAARDQERLERAEATLAISQKEFGDVLVTTEFIGGDPVDALKAELVENKYTLLMMRVNRRQQIIPSQSTIKVHKIIKQSPIPILLVRKASEVLDRMLICTGGLEISEPVVTLSARLAGQVGMKASLLTVSAPVPSMYTGMDEMEETLEEVLETETPLSRHLHKSAELLTKSGVDAEIKVKHGDVVEAILEEAGSGDYDLLVLGSSEAWTLRGLLLGNVTQQIINRAPCAVLVVKQPEK